MVYKKYKKVSYKNKMTGPKTRKWTCAGCSHYRWCEDFGGASANDLDSHSVCDFCLLEQRLLSELRIQAEGFQAQLRDMKAAHSVELHSLKEELKSLRSSTAPLPGPQGGKRSEKLKKKKQKKKDTKKSHETPDKSSKAAAVGDDGLGTSGTAAMEDVKSDRSSETVAAEDISPDGSSSVSAVEDISQVRSPEVATVAEEPSEALAEEIVMLEGPSETEGEVRPEQSSNVVAEEEVRPGRADKAGGWKVVQSKKKKTMKKKKKKGNAEGASTPRHEVHGKLFGDSQVKELGKFLSNSGMGRVQVTTLPGKGNKDIRREVERSTADKTGVAVIAASGNDLYMRHGAVGETAPIILDVMGAVDDAVPKAPHSVVIGIIPRLRWSSVAYSKNIGINNSLKDLCHRETAVTFVDPYDEFYGRPDLFLKDGVHLSGRGKAKLVALVKEACRQARLRSGSAKRLPTGKQQKTSANSRAARRQEGGSSFQGSGNGSS